jgi:glycosyltransferase involved in cell wall biosynthesis
MHILFLTDNFPPEGNAPATRTYEHAREWVKLGHKVTIITGAPNFPEGKVYQGYKNRLYSREQMEGIEVRRVVTYITANEGFVKRILDYLSFMASAFIAGLFVRKPDIVVATSPQFFCALGGWMLSAVRFKPFVFELRDIWPASITAVGAMKPSRIIHWLERLELFLYRRADRIVSVTQSFKRELVARGIDGGKIDVVLNGVDLSKYQPMGKDPDLVECHGLQGKFVAAYIGTHGLAHALDTIVEAAVRLQHRDDIRILFAGGGADAARVEALVRERQLSNVVFMGRQDKSLMPRIWSLCDLSVVHLRDTELFRSVIPSKIFESFAMGLPVLMSVPEGEATSIVQKEQAGLVISPQNVDAMVSAIEHLADNPALMTEYSQHALDAAPRYDRKSLAGDMLAILNRSI